MRKVIIGIIVVVFAFTFAEVAKAKNAVKKGARSSKREGTPTQPLQIQTPQEQVAALRRRKQVGSALVSAVIAGM